uniref:calymmin isoform X11 n=1 Tax=Gasterosteus aculeatus aculeatus TaxID=481459 RepID=UPI001A996A2F|nr:calymmin isoform X11 [Gasterosteus aculeatus aculeatus]
MDRHPQPHGNKPQSGGGVGRMLMPSKGYGAAAAGGANGGGMKGYGAAAGQVGRPRGYGIPVDPTNGQQMKGYGNGAAAAAHIGLGTKGNGYGAVAGAADGNGAKTIGQGAKAGPYNGNGAGSNGQGGQVLGAQHGYGGYPTKGQGYGAAVAGGTNGGGMKGYGAAAGVNNGQGGLPRGYGVKSGPTNGHQMKGNGQGAKAGPFNGNGAGSNGQVGQALGAQNGYGGYPTKGQGYGAAAAGGTNGGGMKGYGAAAGVSNGQGGLPRGYGVKSGPTYGHQMNGYGAVAGVADGNGAKTNGQGAKAGTYNNNGAGSNGQGGQVLGAQHGYGGYPTKSQGYGAAAAGGTNGGGMKGYGAAAGVNNGQGGLPREYGVKSGPTNGQQMKGYGNGAAAAAHIGLGTKGNGYGAVAGVADGNGAKTIGQGAKAGPYNGNGAGSNGQGGQVLGAQHGYGGYPTKGQGYGAAAGGTNGGGMKGYGVKSGPTNGQQMKGYAGGSRPIKGYGRPFYGSGPGVTTGGYAGMGAPQPRNQGYNGGYGSAGLGLGARFGNGGMKGPKLGYRNIPNEYGARPNGVGNGAIPNGYGTRPNGHGFRNGAALGGYGNKPNGYDMVPNGNGAKSAGWSNEKSLKGGLFSPDQPSEALRDVVALPQGITPGAKPGSPEPTSGVLVMVTQDKYQKLRSPVTHGKSYKQTPEPAPATPQVKGPKAAPELGLLGPKGNVPMAATSDTQLEDLLPQENRGASVSKGQEAKPNKPDCGPSGVPNGQWMKIPRSGYKAGASTGTNIKGYGAAAGVPNRYDAKPNSYGGGGGYTAPGHGNGYGNLGYPFAGKPKPPGYGQGAHLGAGNGNSYKGNGNGYSADVQPDYASLGQGANGKSGVARQMPYNGAPVDAAGIDGMSQFEPQSAGLDPNGKLGSMYGGMGGSPTGGQTLGMGAENYNTKYGIGGLQFGEQPLSTETNGPGKYGFGGSPYGPAGDATYGGVGAGMGGEPAPQQYGYGGFPDGGQLLASNGNTAGKYGYGRMPYEAQPAPEAISTGQYGLPGSSYQSELPGQRGMLPGKYGAGEVPYAPQTLGFMSEATPFGEYENQRPYESQALESASESRSGGQHENNGYINGQVRPEVVELPATPTPSPPPAPPSVTSHRPADSFGHTLAADVEDPPEPAGLASDSAPAAETEGVAQESERADDLQQQLQLPRQIHIQQHLKLHFHPQGEKNNKHDLNGFFGNSGYQG